MLQKCVGRMFAGKARNVSEPLVKAQGADRAMPLME